MTRTLVDDRVTARAVAVIIPAVVAYDLDGLGWLLFERLATDALERELGIPASAWQGAADQRREALCDAGVPALGVREPALARMAWVRRGREGIAARVAWAAGEEGDRPVLLVVNAGADEVPDEAADRVLDRAWLASALERDGALRLAHPSALGLRDGGPAIPRPTPSFDRAAAAELARVFVPVRAHARALQALRAHRFAVLTGPPEMGKTAIARMVALALATDGWEAHECIRPDEVHAAWRDDRPQVFVADDAFGSTEYRPDAGERWAREMERLLRALDERHWLIWTSRPAPLRVALNRIHRERGAERFPRPAQVVVDASALDRAEKALILLRHAKAAGASGTALADLVRGHGDGIVEDPHFTPERIRRLAAGPLMRLDADPRSRVVMSELASAGVPAFVHVVEIALRDALREPTEAMAASFRALDRDHRAVLVALLDCPPGPVAERDLAAAARRHADGGLPRAPAELMDRLADHFLRVTEAKVSWVHPSWRDLVIDELVVDRAARRRFLAHAELEGVLLALAVAGGRAGERVFPLLVDDGDWDLVTDRVAALAREADDHNALRLLAALETALAAETGPSAGDELYALSGVALRALRRRLDRASDPPPVALLAAWLALAERAPYASADPAAIERTWFALMPGAEPPETEEELRAADDWLWLVEVLGAYRGDELRRLGFPERHGARVRALVVASEATADDAAGQALRDSIHRRLSGLPFPHPLVRARVYAAPDPDWPPPARRLASIGPIAGESTVARILRDL
jgi:Mrp family chromosome partitioning ATPase